MTQRAVRLAVYGPVLLLALLGPALFWHGGIMEREAAGFITQYTADRPVLNKVFDPRANDLGTYQGRELSYFVDFLDALVYRLILRRFGRPLFIPFSALAASLALVIIFMRGVGRTTSHIGSVAGALLLCCFLSSFMFVSTMGVFYRSSKALVAAFLLALLFHIRRVLQKRGQSGVATALLTREALTAFSLALFAGLADREGFFYVVVVCVMLGVHYRWSGQLRDVLIACIAAAVVLQLYNFVLGPLAIRLLNGYWPDFSYQRLPVRQAIRVPLYLAFALAMMLQNAILLMGGAAGLALIALCALAILVFRTMQQPAGGRTSYLMNLPKYQPDRRKVVYGALAFGSQVLMFALMIARHPFVYFLLDHRYWYYAMPYVVTVLFGVMLALDGVMAQIPLNSRWMVSVVLLCIVVSNLASLDHRRRVMREWAWFRAVYVQSEALRSSLRTGVASPLLDSYYLPFFEYHQKLRLE